MKQISKPHPAGTFTAFRIVVVSEAIVFLFAATLHTGAFGVHALYYAMIVEGLCGIGCVISAYAMFTHKKGARKTAIIVQFLILAGVLLGITALMSDVTIRTPINISLHGIMLALIVIGLILLAIPGTRQAFNYNHTNVQMQDRP